jgi:hypothetical protein
MALTLGEAAIDSIAQLILLPEELFAQFGKTLKNGVKLSEETAGNVFDDLHKERVSMLQHTDGIYDKRGRMGFQWTMMIVTAFVAVVLLSYQSFPGTPISHTHVPTTSPTSSAPSAVPTKAPTLPTKSPTTAAPTTAAPAAGRRRL